MKRNRVFSEVYSVLNALGNKYIDKIPKKVFEIIEKNRDLEYEPEIDRNKALNKQNISKEAINMIAKIDLDFWCKTNQEKSEMHILLKENEKRENERLINNMFKK